MRFSADAVSYLLDANPVASEESLEKQRETPGDQAGRKNKEQSDHKYLPISFCSCNLLCKKTHLAFLLRSGGKAGLWPSRFL